MRKDRTGQDKEGKSREGKKLEMRVLDGPITLEDLADVS